MNLIVSAAIVLLNPYVTVYISYKIPPFALSVHIPDVSTSIYVEGKHSKKCTFYTLRFGCSFAAVNTIKPQLL